MTVSNAKIFVDTNILYYANDTLSQFGSQASARLNELSNLNNTFCISAQVVREYSNVTLKNAIRNNLDLAVSVADLQTNFQFFQENFQILFENQNVLTEWQNLLPRLTSHRDLFDFNIAATLKVYNIPYILTHNVNDFVKFSDFVTVLPLIV
jgi:predicted nucleic acid-binding protein